MAARKKKKKSSAPRPVRKVAKKAARKAAKKRAGKPAARRVAKPVARAVGVDTLKAEQARLERNKKLVIAFYQKMIGEKDPEAARRFMGETYRQHSAYARDGFEGVAEFARTFKENFPNHHYEIKKVIAEGDFVVLHLHGQSGMFPNGEQVVDMFRVVDGKVVEHWDVIQEIPATASNPNGTF